MTKRLHYTNEDVIDQLSDEEDDYDNPDKPMIEGSDDEFSELEMDKRDYEDLYGPVNLGSPSSLAALPGSSTLSGGLPCSPTSSGTPHSTPSPQGSPSPDQSPRMEWLTPTVTIEEFTSRMSPTVIIQESLLEVFELFFFPMICWTS